LRPLFRYGSVAFDYRHLPILNLLSDHHSVRHKRLCQVLIGTEQQHANSHRIVHAFGSCNDRFRIVGRQLGIAIRYGEVGL
jgi:hypothetical protein